MPRNGQLTRERLLAAAEKLVERNGFAATSVDMILAEAGSSKGAFFHHFASKTELAVALVERYVDADIQVLQDAVASVESVADPVEKLLAFLDFFVARYQAIVEEPACIYIAALLEQSLLADGPDAQVERAIVTWRTAVAALISAAYDALPAAVDRPAPDALADHLFVVFEGSYLMCRAARSPLPMHTHLLVYRQLVAALVAGD